MTLLNYYESHIYMKTLDACTVIDNHRDNSIVVCTMGAMNAIDKLPSNPLTIACVPLMGGASSIALGLALSRPERKIMVFDGDASLLMELGSLVTISDSSPTNLIHFVFNNSVQFAGLGNLDTPGARQINFVEMALACGYKSSYRIDSISCLENSLIEIFDCVGPTFVELVVESEDGSLCAENPSIEMTDDRFVRMGNEIRRVRKFFGFDVCSTV